MSDRPSETQADLSTSLRATRLGVWLAMAAERLWPLLLPLLALAGVFLILAWFGVFRTVTDQTRIGLLVMLAIAGIGALALLPRFRLPGGAEVETRIEAANRLEHAPLRTQTEELGGKGDHFADALWREHRRRMAAKLNGLGADLPRPNIPAYDKWALRSLVPLVAIIAFA